MPEGALPNLIIIGAMKCATTSLHYYLDLHPEISMSREKELNFFSRPEVRAKGLDWYRGRFDPSAVIRGESSPSYTSHPTFPDVPARMHAVIPEARLIYLVRDPLERLLAHYRHNYSDRTVNGTIREALRAPDSTMVLRSRYATQLEQYLAFYPPERILVVQQESLLRDRFAELERVFRFLGVDPSVRSLWFRYRRHRSARKRRLSDLGVRLAETRVMSRVRRLPEWIRWPLLDVAYAPFSSAVPRPELPAVLEKELLEIFRGETERLRRLTGMRLEGWRV